jgi:hypothetical protein
MKNYISILFVTVFIFGSCQQSTPKPTVNKQVDKPKIDEVYDSLTNINLLVKPENGFTVDYGYVAETNLIRLTNRMEVFQDSLSNKCKQRWTIDPEGAFDIAEYKAYIEKNMREAEEAFQRYYEFVININTPSISGFGGSGTVNIKMEFQALLITNRIVELKELLK